MFPAAERLSYETGVMYRTPQFDVAQRVEQHRLREFIVVRESQGVKVWQWQLHAFSPTGDPWLRADGRVELGGGYIINKPTLLDYDGAPIAGRKVHWQLKGSVLELRVDDRGLALPYMVDPDTTAPVLSFTNWSESSPYAYYDNLTNTTQLWYNPNQAGAAVAQAYSNDPETGTAFVTFPSPAGGFSAGGNQNAGASVAGLVGTYYDQVCTNTYPGGNGSCGNFDGTNGPNFGGASITRTDADINFNWAAGTPFAALGTDSFSISWVGQFKAPTTDTYFFQTNADDGTRVTVNGTTTMASCAKPECATQRIVHRYRADGRNVLPDQRRVLRRWQ